MKRGEEMSKLVSSCVNPVEESKGKLINNKVTRILYLEMDPNYPPGQRSIKLEIIRHIKTYYLMERNPRTHQRSVITNLNNIRMT